MKKLFVSLFILFLCIPASACAAQKQNDNEPSIASTESVVPSSEEENTIETIDTVEEASGTISTVSRPEKNITETIASPDAESTETVSANMSDSEDDSFAASEENCYQIVTDIPQNEVENYAVHIKQQFIDHDWAAISTEIAYPITVAGITYSDSNDFLAAAESFENCLDESFFTALEVEDCRDMFCTWEGIMIGESGQIWISEVLDASFNSQGLKIIAINGLIQK